MFERRRQSANGELLLLSPKGNSFKVANIGFPDGSLEAPEYNAIVGDFAELVSSVFGNRVTVTLGPDQRPALPERLGSEAMVLLEAYEGGANREKGGTHPSDRERWNQFVIACHQANVGEPEDIRGFLQERGWAERHVEAYADHFELGRELLASYDPR